MPAVGRFWPSGYDDGGHEDDDVAGGHASDILVAVLFTCVVDNVES